MRVFDPSQINFGKKILILEKVANIKKNRHDPLFNLVEVLLR
jgi:hypothetical protein